MQHCQQRPRVLRALAVALVVLVASRFAFQVNDGSLLLQESGRGPGTAHFVAGAFPTAEAGLVAGR